MTLNVPNLDLKDNSPYYIPIVRESITSPGSQEDWFASPQNLAKDLPLANLLMPGTPYRGYVEHPTQPTQSVVYTTSSIASPRRWAFVGAHTTLPTVSHDWYTLTVGSSLKARNTGGSYFFASNLGPANVTDEYQGVGDGSSDIRFEFIHEGETAFEFHLMNYAQHYRVWVDGMLVTTGVTTDTTGLAYYATGSDFAERFHKFTFADIRPRHIAIEVGNPLIGGIVTGPAGSCIPVGRTKPRVLCIGDSFLGGNSGCITTNVWGWQLGRAMGWDVHVNGEGGSGFVTAGSGRGKFITRIPYFANIKFDAVVIIGGYNDSGVISSLSAEVISLLQLIRTTWPMAPIFIGVNSNKGVDNYGLNHVFYQMQNITNAACARVEGCYPINVQQMTIQGTPFTTTMTASTIVGATTFLSARALPVGSTVEIGTGATADRRIIRSVSGLTNTVIAMAGAHTVGDAITQIGGSWVTGTGQVGTTTGYGTSDRYVYSDGTHPMRAGAEAMAQAAAFEITCRIREMTNRY